MKANSRNRRRLAELTQGRTNECQQQTDVQPQQVKIPKTFRKFRADSIIDKFEVQIQARVEYEFNLKKQMEKDHEAKLEAIKLLESMQKRRVQNFLDPRSNKIRKNLEQLNNDISQLKKLDPQMQILEKLSSNIQNLTYGKEGSRSLKDLRKTRNLDIHKPLAHQKSNANILNSILSLGKQSTIGSSHMQSTNF